MVWAKANDAVDTFQERLQFIRGFKLPFCKPTVYAKSSSSAERRDSTRLDPTTVTDRGIPRELKVYRNDELPGLEPIRSALENFLFSSHFPEAIFRPDGPLDNLRGRARDDAETIPPSGETGVSHWLKTALFDPLNETFASTSPGEARSWKVIGIGKTGKTEWALFMNGVMVVILELKPHIVLPSQDMTAVAAFVLGTERCQVSSSWAQSSVKAQNVLYQMWAEFSHETACETVKYAVVLYESYEQQSSSGEGFDRYHSSAMLLSRTEDHIGVTASPVRGSPFEEVNRLEVVGGEGAMSLITADRNSLVGSKG